MAATVDDPANFDEPEWERLLDRIDNRHVLPVVGPAFVTVDSDGTSVPLMQALAGPLAQRRGGSTFANDARGRARVLVPRWTSR